MNHKQYNYLFLDIDGVLNATDYMRHPDHLMIVLKGHGRSKVYFKELVDNLNEVFKECPDVKIVLSSTWRLSFDQDELQDLMDEMGIKTKCIGKTTHDYDRYRGNQIKQWLIDHDAIESNYVIVDDDSDMLDEQLDRFVHVNSQQGLTIDHAKQIIEIFKGKENG